MIIVVEDEAAHDIADEVQSIAERDGVELHVSWADVVDDWVGDDLLQVVGIEKVDGEDNAVLIDMGRVLDTLPAAAKDAPEVLMLLLKVYGALGTLGARLQEKLEHAEVAERRWRAAQNKVYGRKGDESNPLVQQGIKVTNKAIDAAIRRDAKYAEFKRRIADLNKKTTVVWRARDVIEVAVDAAKMMLYNPESIEAAIREAHNGRPISDITDRAAGFTDPTK